MRSIGMAGTGKLRAILCCAVAWALVLPCDVLADEGDLDLTFSGDGAVFGEAPDAGYTLPIPLAIQSNDSIISVDGRTLVRYGPTGEPDSTFGDRGAVELAPGNDDDLVVPDIQVDELDRIYVTFNTLPVVPSPANRPDGGTVRLLPDGAIDRSFGTDGRILGFGLGLRADGGVAYSDGRDIVVLTPDGQPDTTFSGDGRVSTSGPGGAGLPVFRPDGRLLVVSTGTILQYLPDGSPDPSFGRNGYATFSGDYSPRGFISDATLGPGGFIYAKIGTCSFGCDAGVIRIDLSGRGEDGFLAAEGLRFVSIPTGLLVDDQSRINVGTTSYPDSGNPAISIARTTPAGDLDPGFGLDGFAIARPKDCVGSIGDLEIDSQGRVVASGVACDLPAVVRFSAADGPADLDADRTRDRKDRCVQYPDRRHLGCPKRERKVEVTGIEKGSVEGTVASVDECANRVKVRLMKRQPGRDEFVGSDRTGPPSEAIGSRWKIKAPASGKGNYYAEVRSSFRADRSFCSPDESRARPLG